MSLATGSYAGLRDLENGSQKSGLVLFRVTRRVEEQRIEAVVAKDAILVFCPLRLIYSSHRCATESPKTRPGGRPLGRHSEYQIFHERQGRR